MPRESEPPSMQGHRAYHKDGQRAPYTGLVFWPRQRCYAGMPVLSGLRYILTAARVRPVSKAPLPCRRDLTSPSMFSARSWTLGLGFSGFVGLVDGESVLGHIN